MNRRKFLVVYLNCVAFIALPQPSMGIEQDRQSEIEALIKKWLVEFAPPKDVDEKNIGGLQLQGFSRDLSEFSVEALIKAYLRLENSGRDESEFLLEGIVIAVVEKKDPKAVESVLSVRCPKIIYIDTPIEYFLALAGPRFLLALVYAGKATKDSGNKAKIVKILSEAFSKMRTDYLEEDAFLEAVSRVILSRGDELRINNEYSYKYAQRLRVKPELLLP